MAEVDPRFRQMGKGARRRRRRGSALRGGLALVVLGGVGVVAWPRVGPHLAGLLPSAQGQEMVQVASQFDIAPVVRTDTFTDIPGDPLIIPAPEDGAGGAAEALPTPAALSARLPGQRQVQKLDSALVPQDRQLVAALPSTREEFALFQAERGRERLMNASLSAPVDNDTSGIAFLRDAASRPPLWRELIVEVARDTPPADLLAQNGFSRPEAEALAARLTGQLSLDDTLPRGTVLALRYRPYLGGRQVIQLSLYGQAGYGGSLALSAAGQLVPAADPWADRALLTEAMAPDDAPQGQQRLLDVIYSAALRSDVPPEIIGEALALMSQVHDLDGYADPADRLTLIYGGASAGSVLFVGVTGPSGEKLCYVVPEGDGYRCHAPGARVRLRAGGTELLPPVGGVLSQRFIPPTEEGAQGRGLVVWTAPQGSPVMAAAAGKVTAVKDGMIEIAHEDGMVSRYLGLAATAPSIADGTQVARGMVIGQVGTPPGRSEPGLAYQLLQAGRAVDPMPFFGGTEEVLASDSIESLIGHIIRVESAGDASAKNPRSTATGLGQFIESTWLRMMRSYRPDLVATLSSRELLDLRFDAGLSRQMVRHLAQENEAFLRARGHGISAGRLYLAHFLGPAGADMALRADPGQSVESVMGGAVVGANPFLRGWSIGQLQDWADRKMSGKAGAPVMAAEPPASPEVRAFMAEMDQLRRDSHG